MNKRYYYKKKLYIFFVNSFFVQFQQQNYVKVLGLHNNFTLNSAEYEGKPPQELHQGALDSTSVSTHCTIATFW